MTRINVASETSVAYKICADLEKVSGFQYHKPLQNSNLGEVDAIRYDVPGHIETLRIIIVFFVHVHVLDQSAMQCFHQYII